MYFSTIEIQIKIYPALPPIRSNTLIQCCLLASTYIHQIKSSLETNFLLAFSLFLEEIYYTEAKINTQTQQVTPPHH